MKTLFNAVSCAALIALCSLAGAQGQPQTVELNIDAPTMAKALIQFTEQSGLHLIFPTDGGMAQLPAPRVTGAYTPKDALEKLLSNSGLKYEYVDARTIVVHRKTEEIGTQRPAAHSMSSEAGLVQLAQATATQAGGSPEASDGSDGSRLEEIVVTAQKREERLQDVPISISVLSGRNLDRFTGEGVNEALAAVPGVAVKEDNWNSSNVSVRGVASPGGVIVGSSPVAYYIDSVPFGFVKSAVGPDTSAYDLERVEVLRGPQGTLYGASALNGVIRVLTRDASLDEYELKARASLSAIKGGSESYRGDLAVNVPLIEGKVAARAVLGYAEVGGWLDKVEPAQYFSGGRDVFASDVNDRKLTNLRLRVNAQPTDHLTVGLSAWRSEIEAGASPLSDDNDFYPGVSPAPTASNFDVLGLKIGYQFSGFSFTSATSYIDYSNQLLFDYSPFSLNTLFSDMDAEVFAQEVLLNSKPGGVWRWSAGAFYRDAKDRWYQEHDVLFTPPVVDFSDFSESVAVFGELTRVFMNGRVELTGGLRYFEDDVSEISDDVIVGIRENAKFDNVSPRVVLTWHPSERLTAYASYAEGFRSGFSQVGQNVRLQAPPGTLLPVKEDKLSNYELGAKGNVFGGRLAYDAAIYYIDWQDVQQTLCIFIVVNGVPFCYSGVVNSESASGPGIDLAVTGRPLDGLELGVSVSWNDLTSDADVPLAGAVVLAKGDRLKGSSEYTAGVSAGYAFPLAASGLEGRMAISANYGSKLYNPRDLSISDGRQVTPLGDSLLNSRASFSVSSQDHWTVDLFVDNVTNYRGTYEENAIVPFFAARARPRVIGLQLEYQFGK